MDLNMLVSLETIRRRPDYQVFADLVEQRSTQCSPKWQGMSCGKIGQALKTLRERATGSGAEACPAANAGEYTCSVMGVGAGGADSVVFGPRATANASGTAANATAPGCYGSMGDGGTLAAPRPSPPPRPSPSPPPPTGGSQPSPPG